MLAKMDSLNIRWKWWSWSSKLFICSIRSVLRQFFKNQDSSSHGLISLLVSSRTVKRVQALNSILTRWMRSNSLTRVNGGILKRSAPRFLSIYIRSIKLIATRQLAKKKWERNMARKWINLTQTARTFPANKKLRKQWRYSSKNSKNTIFLSSIKLI